MLPVRGAALPITVVGTKPLVGSVKQMRPVIYPQLISTGVIGGQEPWWYGERATVENTRTEVRRASEVTAGVTQEVALCPPDEAW